MSKSKFLIRLAAGLGLIAASAVHAQGYLGAGAGWTKIDADCSGVADLGGRCDNSSTGGKLYGGYRYASGLAFEGVYFDWGKATAEYTEPLVAGGRPGPLEVVPIIEGSVKGKLRATGFGLGVAYFMPFATNWSGVARLGMASNRGKLTATVTVDGISSSDSTSESSWFPYFGLGVGYQLTPNLALTGEADFSRVKYGAGGEYEKDDVRLISIGLRYAF
jgi:OOP family OmpA-OmpF porin